MRRFPTFAQVTLLFLCFVLFACAREEAEVPPPAEPVEEQGLLTEEELTTPNVTYTGLLEEGGATIYQQGTHRLTLTDGRMVLLEPAPEAAIALPLYTGKLVRVRGDVRPTVEAGGTLMQVKEIAWIRREADAEGSEVEVLRVLCGGDAGSTCPEGFTCVLEETSGICMEASEGGAVSSSAGASSPEAPEGASVSSPASSSSSSAAASAMEEGETSSSSAASEAAEGEQAASVSSPAADERVALMAAEDFAPGRWTQEYCSSHVNFCIPVHKNWYFKSFGALSSILWHVEIGPENVDELGDGPLTVELRSGDLASVGAKDNDLKEAGGKVTGYRAWSDSRHFAITGDAALRDPVAYITKALRQGP